MGQETILLVEDDEDIRELIQLYLAKHQFQTLLAGDGQRALELFQSSKPDLVILDVMIPRINGLDVCKEMRKTSTVPILFISSKDESEDIVRGLESGGDYYLSKPFDPSVLVAKVKASLRRTTFHRDGDKENSRLTLADLEIDMKSYEFRLKGKPLTFSLKESQLLLLLAQNPNQVFSVEQLYTKIWGPYEVSDPRTVMVHISNLRKKIEPNPANPKYILTVRGYGYKFGVSS